MRALLPLPLLVLGGCASTEPPGWPEIEPLGVAPPEGVQLAAGLRAGVAWTEDWLGDPRTYLDRLDELRVHQEQLLEHAVTALSVAPIRELSLLRGRATAPEAVGDPLRALARIGAEDDLDLVIVLRTRSDEEAVANGFSPLFLLLVTAPIVPGYHLRVAAAAQLCALRVADALVVSCATERAEASERFVTPLRARTHHRGLRFAAMQEAVGDAALALTRDLRRRAHAAPRLTPLTR